MRTLVLGGTRSGKSAYAESLPPDGAEVRYVATLLPPSSGDDDELAYRIRRHRERRPSHWQVVEAGTDLIAALSAVPPRTTVLIDGLTLWLAAVLEGANGNVQEVIGKAVSRMAELPQLIVVSDDVSGGLVPPDPLARRFRDLAGEMHQQVAAVCDRVVLVTAGLPLELKSPKDE